LDKLVVLLVVVLLAFDGKIDLDSREAPFRNGTLLLLRKMELRLDVLLRCHSRLFSAVLVGRREEADRNRNAGVKVQIADF
jgi:hypothetical protein